VSVFEPSDAERQKWLNRPRDNLSWLLGRLVGWLSGMERTGTHYP